jgi:exodeoxyribonuclease VII large subunit
VTDHRARLAQHAQTVQAHSPARELIARRDNLEQLRRRLEMLPTRALENARQRFGQLEAMARLLGPEATLRRGYSITLDQNGNVVRSVGAVKNDDTIRTKLVDGELAARVTGVQAT